MNPHGHHHARLAGLYTDLTPESPHHTLGPGPTQAAPGNHTHTLLTPVTGHAARSGGATGSFNNTTPTGAALASVSLTLTLDPALTYGVTGWGSAMLQAGTASTWVGCAVALNSTVGDFVGHKSTTLAATPVAAHHTVVSGQSSVGCTLNVRNDLAGSNTIGDASLFVVAKPLRTATPA